jgi:hypothetical protein
MNGVQKVVSSNFTAPTIFLRGKNHMNELCGLLSTPLNLGIPPALT